MGFLIRFVACSSLLYLSSLSSFAQAGSFEGMGKLGGSGYSSSAQDVSSDGSTVVGYAASAEDGGNVAARWTSVGGLESLGTIDPGWLFGSQAFAVSPDGSIIVGVSDSDAASTSETFIVDFGDTGVMTGLGTLGGYTSTAYGVSSDGSAVVGRAQPASSFDFKASLWTDSVQNLGTLGGLESEAYDISGDGSIVVGTSDTAGGHEEAFIWTDSEGMVSLGMILPCENCDDSGATAISEDGTVVVGHSDVAGGVRAFRWTAAGGMEQLGVAPGPSTFAEGVSVDGSVVVGHFNNETDALFWTQATGVMSVKDYLVDVEGINLDGWSLESAEAVAVDGDSLTIVDNGFNPDGFQEGWIATIIVPEPDENLCILVALGIVFFLGLMKRSACSVEV